MKKYLLFLCVVGIIACTSEQDSETEISEQQQEEVMTEATSPVEVVDNSPTTNLVYVDEYAQLPWQTLTNVTFETGEDAITGEETLLPIFNETIEALSDKPVMIKGYVIPIGETGLETMTILSAFPYSQCFFCGNAGPESVIDIHPKEKLGRLKMDKQVTFKGKLSLNAFDSENLIYALKDAEIVD